MTILLLPFQFVCVLFIGFFFCLIAVSRTSNTMLDKSGESGTSCLVPDIKKNAFSFFPLSMMLAVVLLYVAFIMLRFVPSVLVSLTLFSGCWILSKALFLYLQI